MCYAISPLQDKLRYIRPPEMLLRIYSLCILALDLVTLFIGVSCTILTAVYRMFRPPPLKNLNYEVAMVHVTVPIFFARVNYFALQMHIVI